MNQRRRTNWVESDDEMETPVASRALAETVAAQEWPRSLFLRNWAAFFLLGTINNLAYVVVNSSAESLSDSFFASNLLGLIPWANVGFGFVARAVATGLRDVAPYPVRFFMTGSILLVGLLMLSFAPSFGLVIASIVVCGFSSSFGESVTLGYLRLFPPELVNAWSSGTGMAGVAGSALYLLLSGMGMTNRQVFLFSLPSVALYWLTYVVIVKRSDGSEIRAETDEREALLDRAAIDAVVQADDDANGSQEDDSVSQAPSMTTTLAKATKFPTESSFKRYMRCTRLVLGVSCQLAAVYFFEYVISSGLSAKVLTAQQQQSKSYVYVHAYALLSFCYQAGVFVSRSSLQLLHIHRISILTLLQAANFVLWMVDAHYRFLPIGALLPLMVFVGLLGGAMYVNVFYLVLNDPDIANEDRELCINIVAFAITIGITLGCAAILLFDNTFLK